MQKAVVIRNGLLRQAAVTNARAFPSAQETFGTFDRHLRGFVHGRPQQNRWRTIAEVSAVPGHETGFAQKGFQFEGSVICYVLMQALGLVNDHAVDCFRHAPIRVPGGEA